MVIMDFEELMYFVFMKEQEEKTVAQKEKEASQENCSPNSEKKD